jgi:hypothetical protein
MKAQIILLFSLISFSAASLFINPYPKFETHSGGDDLKDEVPLFITPLLEQGKDVAEIQKMASVDHPDLKAFPSYSKFISFIYLTVCLSNSLLFSTTSQAAS